ncbi:PREDICTED: inhibitor of trypsin and hageman factor-like [Camelina sativa]|uniref:Inhibitor of trypsin and hageman factor-like n=1 Tax=Camelina sativa TaxID=90675 RepID=A0ABM1R976_CAMSA|nr:PREDICTED: inhibitor of trypsin and hageman factor-like [Camelina sativa]
MSNRCPILGPRCELCNCSGSGCQSQFPGLKVEWPTLKGVSGLQAKATIESDNPRVTAFIYREGVYLPSNNCCNRVVLYVRADDCPNGPVLNRPIVG